MKKAIAITLCFVVMLSFGVTAPAAGTDDGRIMIATLNGQKFFGTEIGENAVKYIAAKGEDELFTTLPTTAIWISATLLRFPKIRSISTKTGNMPLPTEPCFAVRL